MSYSTQEILDQIAAREDSRWEFKQVEIAGTKLLSPKRSVLADEIAAFANARGGVLLCSVTDDGQVQDLSGDQLAVLDAVLVELSTDSIKPPVRIATHHRRLPDGKLLAVVEVPEGEAHHRSPGGSYVRVGGTKREMTTEEQLRLAPRRGQARFLWFDKQPVPGTGFRTLDESLWKPMLDAQGRLDPRRGLTKLALLTSEAEEEAEATVAGVVLCSRAPEQWLPNACITATHYRGENRSAPQLDAQVITGPLHRQVADAMRFVERNMRVGAHKSPARMDLPEYSLEAVFEAMVNAVAHRDYAMRGSRIRLSMFAGRLEINAPGGLPNNLTIADMAARQSTRNEAIVSVLARLPVGEIPGSHNRLFFMERRGSGVPVIVERTRALSGRPPEYRLLQDADLFLTLPAAPTNATPQTVNVAVRSGRAAVAGAEVVGVYPSGIRARGVTDQNGEASLDLFSTALPVTVLVGAPGYAAGVQPDWTPSSGALDLDLQPLPRGGSVILPDGRGRLPTLRGSLRVQRDDMGRTTASGDLTINEGEAQPVHFTPGEDLRVRDGDGNRLLLRVLTVAGAAALVEYRAVRG